MSAPINMRSIMDDDDAESTPETHVGERPVGAFAICLLALHLAAATIVIIYTLIAFWPLSNVASIPVRYFTYSFHLDLSIRMFVLVGLAGALGGQIHAVRSFYWYVGNRALYWSWVLKYLTMPLVSASLGLIFYMVLRAGLISAQIDNREINPMGFTATAALVGLFSEQALEKLKRVAETLFAEAPKGKEGVSAAPAPSAQRPTVNVNTQIQPAAPPQPTLSATVGASSQRAIVQPATPSPAAARDNSAFSGVTSAVVNSRRTDDNNAGTPLPDEKNLMPIIEPSARKRDPDE